MAYKKQTWVDLETPLDAEHMNHIEDGIGSLSEDIGNQIKPRVFIDGGIPTTKDDVLAVLTYMHGANTWKAYIKIKCQGSSSMSYPKKNFTVTLYEDEARTIPKMVTFDRFGHPSNKFVLKADWVDNSHARNVISARLWAEIVASRPDYDELPEELHNAPNNGAIDGFPVLVYTNGTCQGIYNWNIGKEALLWGMNEDNPNHVLLCGAINSDGDASILTACNFRALWSGVDGEGWDIEVGSNSASLKTSLNNLISCVKDTDDATFKETIGQYLDVNSAIDYYIFQYFLFGSDNLAKNMLLATYDGIHWICGAYDLDSTWGNIYYGAIAYPATARVPEDTMEPFSLLWERIEKCFHEELKARYAVLRKGALSMANVIGKFDCFIRNIGEDMYQEDVIAYPSMPVLSENNLKQLREYARDRAAYVDEQIAALPYNPGDMVDYTINPLDSVVWAAGGYSLDTGAETAEGGAWRSNPVNLQNCLYKMDISGDGYSAYVDVFAFDKYSGAYIGGTEFTALTDIYFFGNPDYAYTFKVVCSGEIGADDITLMPVDNSDTTLGKIVFDMSAITADELIVEGAYGAVRYNITDEIGIGGSTKPNTVLDSIAVSKEAMAICDKYSPYIGSRRGNLHAVSVASVWTEAGYQTQLVFCAFASAEECAAYLRDNAVIVTINERH